MKSIVKNNTMVSFFKMAFGGMLGVMAAEAVVILYTAFMVTIGYAIIIHANKEGTKPLEELEPLQYVGIIICILGLLPWGQYLIFGLLEGAGQDLYKNMF